jgi:type IV pilus assembly protein PilY1
LGSQETEETTMTSPTRRTPTRSRPARTALALAVGCALALAPSAAEAYTKSFASGSLIIPANMEYQTDCGMTSAYGFIYSVLLKNASLVAAGKKPVTVYWILEPKKLSHHRCNTSTDDLPDYSKYNDNDGCDLAIQSAAGQPVALLKTDNTEQAPFNVFTTSYDTAKGYSTRTSPTPGTALGATKKVVKYSGSLWVIDAADRATVIDMIKTDPLVGSFRDGGNCVNIPVATAGSHHINLHVARTGFTAPVARQMNVKPPLIALLDAGAVTILETYLKNAGLNDPVLLPNAGGTITSHGIIYDTLDPVLDFVSTPTYPNGALNMPDPADPLKTYYQVMWAPHWVADNQSTVPGNGAPGDDQPAVAGWTHYDPATNTYDDPITNALKNIGYFAEQGNGLFMECASIESVEGSYVQTGAACGGDYQCTCTDATKCTVGTVGTMDCAAGTTAACGNCYSCSAGSTLDASVCGEVKCLATPTCTAPYSYACGQCLACTNASYPNPDFSSCSQPKCWNNAHTRYRSPGTQVLNLGTLTTQAAACTTPGYAKTCTPSLPSIDIDGNDATRFMATLRFNKNGLGNSFGGPDCTDEKVVGAKYKYPGVLSGDCLDFHPDTGGPATIYSQKGNFNYTGTSGHIHQYYPPAYVGSVYRPGTLFFATSRNKSNPARDGWDFTTARHKDGDAGKGMIVYLAGHSYANDVAGNRIVLNTMLNLGFSDSGVELARSEPVGYVTKKLNADGTFTKVAETVFQGTYVQRPPPATFQDWVNYNAALPQSWKFPYIDGHLRAYELEMIDTDWMAFSKDNLWDAAAKMPLPGARKIGTILNGRGRAGWTPVELKYTETDPATCHSSRADDTGAPICDLSWQLASCATAGVTQGQLQAGDPTGNMKDRLGMFVQQVRGYCSSHDKVSLKPNFEPTDAKCDDLKQQKNRAKLGGVDHSSPAIVGPSRYIGDEVRAGVTLKWSTRPVVAYVGARDGMLHAIYVSGDAAWSAEGRSLPAGVVAGQELWAIVPPGQLCGLHTNTAMVDATMNVVDAFASFPVDANHDGVIDWSSAAERPSGRRTWRTVLVASVGEGGSELFALDVTNPLKPVVLWHVAGAADNDSQWFNPKLAKWEAMDKTAPLTYAYTWYNWDDKLAATTHVPTPYNTASATILDAIKTGRSDYRNMGRAFGTAVGMIWEGNAFRYVVFISASTADWTDLVTPEGYRGIEVFAIDIVTGEKLWQWQNRYTRANAAGTIIADNGIPGRPALLDINNDGAVERLYVGDLEGHMWELDAATGKNVNYLKESGSSKYVSLPYFGTPEMEGAGADASILATYKPVGSATLAQQPLTSPIGLGRLRSVPTTLEQYLRDRAAVAQGTMGVDWTIAPFEKGHVFVLPAYPEVMVAPVKDPVTGITSLKTIDTRERDIDTASKPWLLTRGVLKSAAIWDTVLNTGERVFGMPKIVGDNVLVTTSTGDFSGDISEKAATTSGRILRIGSEGTNTEVSVDGGIPGGVLVMESAYVTTTSTKIKRSGKTEKMTTDTSTNVRNKYTPADFTTWEQLPPAPLK